MKGGLHSFDLDNWLSRVLWGALGTASYNSGLLVMCPAGEDTFMSGLQALAPAVPSVWKAFPVPSDPGHHLCLKGSDQPPLSPSLLHCHSPLLTRCPASGFHRPWPVTLGSLGTDLLFCPVCLTQCLACGRPPIRVCGGNEIN